VTPLIELYLFAESMTVFNGCGPSRCCQFDAPSSTYCELSYNWSVTKDGQVQIDFYDIRNDFYDDYRFRKDANLYNYTIQQLGWLTPFKVSNSWQTRNRTYVFDPTQRPAQPVLQPDKTGLPDLVNFTIGW
jgi:hypothetical protein